MTDAKLRPEILSAALEGLQAQRDRIASQIAEVRRRLVGAPAPTSSPSEVPTQKPRRKMSATARKRIAEAQRRRWEAFHKKTSGNRQAPVRKEPADTAKATPAKKRTMSKAGRKRIAEATRKRWAEFRKKQAAAASKRAGRKKATKKTAGQNGAPNAPSISEQTAKSAAASE